MPPSSPVAVAWHAGGTGTCAACGAGSDDLCLVQAVRPTSLCPACGQAFLDGDDQVVVAVFLIPPEDTSARDRRRQRKSGR
jgi:uncharacterized protein (DUF983 family)